MISLSEMLGTEELPAGVLPEDEELLPELEEDELPHPHNMISARLMISSLLTICFI